MVDLPKSVEKPAKGGDCNEIFAIDVNQIWVQIT